MEQTSSLPPRSRLASRLLTWELGGPKPPRLKIALTSSRAIFRILSALESAGASGHTPTDQAGQAIWLPCGHRLRPQQRPELQSSQHRLIGLAPAGLCCVQPGHCLSWRVQKGVRGPEGRELFLREL